MRRATTSHNSEYYASSRGEGVPEALQINSRNHSTSDAEYQDDPQDKSKLHGAATGSTPKGLLFSPLAQKDRRQSTRQSVLNLVNNILGAGVLGYPYCFKSCGMVLASCLMLVSAMACRMSYQLLLYCAHLTSTKSYEEICERSLGKLGRQLVELCTAALNMGAVVAYINILADVLSAVAGTIIPPGAEPSRDAYVAGVALFGVLPVSLVVRDSSVIAAFSTASLGLVAVFAVVVTIFSLGPNAGASGEVHMWKPEGLLVAFPVMAYGFTAHPYYLSTYSMLQSPNIRRMTRVTDWAMAVVAILYWVVGMGGYMSFRHRTAGDLLRNFGSPTILGLRGAYERGLKLCYGLSVLGSVPGVIMPFHRTLEGILGYTPSPGSKHVAMETEMTARGSNHSHKAANTFSFTEEETGLPLVQHVLVCIMVVGLGMASALWVPNVEFIFGLMGATAAVLIAYILPSISFLRVLGSQPELAPQKNSKAIMVPDEVKWQWRKRKWKAMGLLIFGIVSGIACTDAILSAVHEEAAVVQLAQELVADQVMAAETTHVALKAKEAATTVSAVRDAAKGLQLATKDNTATMGALRSAAAQLTELANNSTQLKPPTASWDLRAKFQEHKQHAAETKVLTSIEASLVEVRRDINSTIHQVLAMVASMDVAMAQIHKEAQKLEQDMQSPGLPAPSNQDKSQPAKLGAEDMAKELAAALGVYGKAYNMSSSSKNLEPVRQNAIAATAALNDTLFVLEHVSLAISLAKASPQHDAQDVRRAAMSAMQKALHAIEASGLALDMTANALQQTASTEASELLTVLTQMVQDVDKSKGTSGKGTTSDDKSQIKHRSKHHDKAKVKAKDNDNPSSQPAAVPAQDPSMPTPIATTLTSGSTARTTVTNPTRAKQDVATTLAAANPTGTKPNDTNFTATNPTGTIRPGPLPTSATIAANTGPVNAANTATAMTPTAASTSTDATTARASQAVQQPPAQSSHQQYAAGTGGHATGDAQQGGAGKDVGQPMRQQVIAEGSSGKDGVPVSREQTAQASGATSSLHPPIPQQATPTIELVHQATIQAQNESESTVLAPPHAVAPHPPSNMSTLAAAARSGSKGQPALTPEQMSAVERIIAHLAKLDTAVGSSSTSSSQGIDQLLSTNFTALASAMESAAQWSADSRETAMQKISTTLTKSHTKVAERVMEFIQDLNKAEKDASKAAAQPAPPPAGSTTPPPDPPDPPKPVGLRQRVTSISSQASAAPAPEPNAKTAIHLGTNHLETNHYTQPDAKPDTQLGSQAGTNPVPATGAGATMDNPGPTGTVVANARLTKPGSTTIEDESQTRRAGVADRGSTLSGLADPGTGKAGSVPAEAATQSQRTAAVTGPNPAGLEVSLSRGNAGSAATTHPESKGGGSGAGSGIVGPNVGRANTGAGVATGSSQPAANAMRRLQLDAQQLKTHKQSSI